ncbi:protein MULTIPOLAR SPINDLE 1 isoform X1 [Beta vulgaris subsp. vulgaris]|uniref:protein MULTIPOLAR SPINDLE 1 isoform X1 n=1 Tax=Beta vulgaris subsp. vulgaris TaxID=3555 RepID=UPI002036A9AB|nr:protein MULTIPOLAR SPINDLE 1 isoform X1 [Beta vulgaris subsp. vulgaris]
MAASTTAPATATNSDESMKIAIAMALLRSKLLSQPSSSSSSRVFHWKQKAKSRKQEILRLSEEIKRLEDDLSCDLYPQSASCKCYFFDDLQNVSSKKFTNGDDHRMNDVLHRRFLRLVRMQKRIKRRTSNSTDQRVFSEFSKEEEIEQLKISAEFLVDLCEMPIPVKKPNFANLAHQAVDFILGHLLSKEKDAALMEGTINSLIVHLVKRMCTPLENELRDPETDAQVHIQYIIRMLGSASYVGQRILLSVCHRISELAEQLLSLDPFDESFALIHDSLFVMIQLIELLLSDYLLIWSKDETFEIRLFEEWLPSFLHARKTLQSMEKRSGLYALYMDRVTGELARQVGQVMSFQKLNQNILDELLADL